jgi:hypothetical protein
MILDDDVLKYMISEKFGYNICEIIILESKFASPVLIEVSWNYESDIKTSDMLSRSPLDYYLEVSKRVLRKKRIECLLS